MLPSTRQLYAQKLTREKQRDFHRALRYRTRRAGLTIRAIALIAGVNPNSLRTWLHNPHYRTPALAAKKLSAALTLISIESKKLHLSTLSPHTTPQQLQTTLLALAAASANALAETRALIAAKQQTIGNTLNL